MPYVAVCLFGPHTYKKSTVTTGLTGEGVDAKFGFHESSFTEFPIEDGVRSFTDPEDSSNEYLVANQSDLSGMIHRISNEIESYEELLDDVGEEESDEFQLFTDKCTTLRAIMQQLDDLDQS